MKQIIELKVRSYELDSYNHVNNAVYLNYLEYARMEYLNNIGFDFKSLTEEGYMLYVTHIDIKYKFSARLNEKLFIEVEHTKLGKLSGTFHQIIRNENDQICVEADVSWGCVNKDGRPSKMPEKYVVEALQPTSTEQVNTVSDCSR